MSRFVNNLNGLPRDVSSFSVDGQIEKNGLLNSIELEIFVTVLEDDL